MYIEDWIELQRQFERRKRTKTFGKLETFTVPLALTELYEERSGQKSIRAVEEAAMSIGKLEFVRQKLRVDAAIFKSWFVELCSNSISQIHELLSKIHK